ncbi:transferase transferring acyl groups [Zea mays]|uniref:Transferase transferring acyl groups n=1 Tax=Zea mays TaxID=4577 RepID=A0A1D6K4F9_MAIZE|nr:transferase transferring acyl groups [Zea mays]
MLIHIAQNVIKAFILQCNFAYVMLVFGQNFQVMCFSMFFCLIILSPSQNSSRFSSIFL